MSSLYKVGCSVPNNDFFGDFSRESRPRILLLNEDVGCFSLRRMDAGCLLQDSPGIFLVVFGEFLELLSAR